MESRVELVTWRIATGVPSPGRTWGRGRRFRRPGGGITCQPGDQVAVSETLPAWGG